MKIAFLAVKGNFDKKIGQGVQTYTYQIWKNVERLAPSSFKISKAELGIGKSAAVRKISFTMSEALHDFSGYDIVHMPAPIMFNPRTGGSIVTTAHEFFLLDEGHPLYISPKKDYNPLMLAYGFIGNSIKNQMLGSDYLFPNSTQTQAEAMEMGFKKERMFMINHAIDDRFTTGSLHQRPSGKFRVGYLGSMHQRKNVAFAIRAFNLIKSNNMIFDAWGKVKPKHGDVITEATKNNHVVLRGFAPEVSKLRIYESFDVFLFPSLYEGFCVEILEAQSRGLPVIIYKKGKIPKEVRKYCFEAEDEVHMAQLIEEISKNGYNDKMRQKVAKYARTFTWKRCATETIAAYKKIAKRG